MIVSATVPPLNDRVVEEEICSIDGKYAGTQNWTVTNKTCERWDSDFPAGNRSYYYGKSPLIEAKYETS